MVGRIASRWAFVLLIPALMLAACSRAPESNKFKVFREQEVSWHKCDSSLFGDPLAPILEEELGSRLECATIQSPLDWQDPAYDTVDLGLLRVKAKDADKRKGAILMNPGGPGGAGLLIAAIFGLIFSTAQDPSRQPHNFSNYPPSMM
jgi:hypothetical protein